MNKFESFLLQSTYSNLIKTGDRSFTVHLTNGDEYFYLSDAAESLLEDGYIKTIDGSDEIRA